MNEIVIYKEPKLAKLENEGKKLRDISMDLRLGGAKVVVQFLLSDLGVSNKADTNHHVRTIKFICDSLINYTFAEIEEAFAMFIRGEFKEKPLQQLNPLIAGKVMMYYENHKKEKLKLWRIQESEKKQAQSIPTLQEQNAQMDEVVITTFLEWKQTGQINGIVTHIYAYLHKIGKLPKHTKEYKENKTKIARVIYKKDLLVQKQKATDKDIAKEVKNLISKSESAVNGQLNTIIKKLVIIDYFNTEESE